ncbi:MAG: DUF3712 domain-containing protein, partial [Candidatus Hodarchaeota archaeon]
LSYQNTIIGHINLTEITFQKGTTAFNVLSVLQSENLTAMQDLITRYLNNQTSTINVKGTYNVKALGMLSRILYSIEISLTLEKTFLKFC